MSDCLQGLIRDVVADSNGGTNAMARLLAQVTEGNLIVSRQLCSGFIAVFRKDP